jgi:hypothetical protein
MVSYHIAQAELCPVCTDSVRAQHHAGGDCLHLSRYALIKDGTTLLWNQHLWH